MDAFYRSGLIAAPLLLVATGAWAQFSGAIQGIVTDTSAAVVPTALVRVTNVSTGVTRHVTGSEEGLFRVLNLAPGLYRVEVEKEGFRSAIRDNVQVAVSETVRVDLALEVGAVADSVTVTEQVPTVETEQGRVSGRIDTVQLKEMPLNGRNLYNLIALQPGVVGRGLSSALGAGGAGNDAFSGEANPQVFASGQRSEANSFTLDDTSVNSAARGGISNLTPNADSVAEVRVVSNNFSAVDGRNSGAQIQVISKTGTNEVRGGLSYFFTNDTLGSRNVFESEVPEFRRNQFGYNVGGPIIRNRTFFFHSYEGLRSSGTRSSGFTVETPEFRDFVLQTRPSSIAARVLDEFRPAMDPTTAIQDLGSPAGGVNVIGPPDGIPDIGTAQFAPNAFRDGNQFSLRIDHELREGKDRLYGNFYRTTTNILNGGIRPAFDRPTDERTHFGSLNHTRIIGPTMLNEFRAGVMRLTGVPRTPPRLDIPQINVAPLSGFSTSFFPAGWFQTNFHFKNVFSWTKSTHTIRAGGELRRVWTNSRNTSNFIPSYGFANILDFANDEALQVVRNVDPSTGEPANNVIGFRGLEYAFFINNDWKVSPTLSINLGLRYESYTTIREVNGILRNLVLGPGDDDATRLANARMEVVPELFSPNTLDFAPRLGFAWNPDGVSKTAIRGGYGIAYDRLFHTPVLDVRSNPPLRASATLGTLFGTDFIYSLGNPDEPFLGYPVEPGLRLGLDERNGIEGSRVAVRTVDPNLRTAHVHNWFVGIQRDVGGGWVAEINYLGSAGRNLYNLANVNRFRGDLLDDELSALNPSFSQIQMIESSSNSIHHGGTVVMRRALSRGVALQAAYTFGKTITDASDLVSVTNYQDIANRDLDRSLADFDVPQKLAVMGLWEIPFLRHGRNIASRIFGGWQLSGFLILQKGTPITPVNNASWPSGDYNADGNIGDRPNAPDDGVRRGGWERSDYLTGIFDAADFPRPDPGENGTLGRNTFRGPGFAQLDVSLAKHVRFGERVTGQLRVDAFNALNRVNLHNPVMDLNSPNFGRSLSTETPRSVQLGFRLEF
ncbi:MAG: hypothetical protein GEU99_13565 [Luteitalea sp.]|nr:hypothetical protein [Luteitalea sp.]